MTISYLLLRLVLYLINGMFCLLYCKREYLYLKMWERTGELYFWGYLGLSGGIYLVAALEFGCLHMNLSC